MSEFAHPRVIVRLREAPEDEGFREAEQYLEERDPAGVRRIRASVGDFRLSPVFSDKVRERLPELQKRAAAMDASYVADPLTSFYYVEAPQSDDLEAVRKVFSASVAVRSAEIEIPGPDPLVNDADDPLAALQTYLGVAPGGLDARYAWGFPGGDGAGQTVVDIEQGWTLNHEDLAGHGITQINGVIVNTSRAHGSAVLGELCALDNTVGCVGFAPNVATVFVASRNPSLADSIVDVLASLAFGDVMLLETQDSTPGGTLGPSEMVEAVWEAIRLGTALGVIVVEAGGNGGMNLDTFTDAAGRRRLFRSATNPDFRDSGAIIVAAGSSAAPHTRLGFSSHGQRIDCFAWGENVRTCSSNAAGATNLYTSTFNGTSSASPMVAGAALCVQGIHQAATGQRLSPRQMRAILSDPAVNTPRAPTETTAIGMMPNLRGIIDNVLDLVPDVYLRDNVGDSGAPHTGAISASPDVILLKFAVGNAQATFGEGSGTENVGTLGDEAEAGRDNFIYVRMRNRGGAAASNVRADLFWSPPSTLVTPNLWTPVGSVTVPNVPATNQLICADAIVWPAAQIPATGHYCFVGMIGAAGDPAPAPAAFVNFANFMDFIKNNNNVTWRNFNVVNRDPSDPEALFALPWLMPGAPEERLVFALDMALRLPPEAEVLLELPLQFLRDFDAQLEIVEVDDGKERATARLPAIGRLRFGPALMAAGARHEMRFLVRLNSKDPDAVYRIELRQTLEGKEEVGRLAWHFDPHAGERRKRLLESA